MVNGRWKNDIWYMTNDRWSINNKKALVTGATKGIGKAIATAYLEAGATVIGTYHSNQSAAEAMLAEFPDKNLTLHQFDIADYEAVENFYKTIEDQDVKIDILVNKLLLFYKWSTNLARKKVMSEFKVQ